VCQWCGLCGQDAGQKPFTYQAGVGGVITGWDQGCLGMSIGEVRNLKIPADEGYGASRAHPYNTACPPL